jgi:hypothetical protein
MFGGEVACVFFFSKKHVFIIFRGVVRYSLYLNILYFFKKNHHIFKPNTLLIVCVWLQTHTQSLSKKQLHLKERANVIDKIKDK